MSVSASFRRLFIANRGEVAVRIARTCDALGITPVFAVSEADRPAPYLKGREYVCLGPARSAESYLRAERVVQAAAQSRCSALHPGWGFLAENPLLASLCAAHGVTFIGPPPDVMALMGKKTPAKQAMKRAGLLVIDGSDGPVDREAAGKIADAVGYPVLLKAESGGGGRGMRIARSRAELDQAFTDASMEARSAFGDERVYVEKLVERGRHVEVQILADRYGNAIHLGERDCTVQRNHQKLIEESPSPVKGREEIERTCVAAAQAARAIGYVGAGTFEFILDDGGKLRFIEMNTRLQVEHTVTEMRCGLDLVAAQIAIAAGQPLAVGQADVKLEGHAIEVRINAEDPRAGFRPTPGRIVDWREPPRAQDLRVETHVESGYTVPPHYDSLLCKIVAWGRARDQAADRLLSALDQFACEGVATTTPLHQAILRSAAFRGGNYHTGQLPGWEG